MSTQYTGPDLLAKIKTMGIFLITKSAIASIATLGYTKAETDNFLSKIKEIQETESLIHQLDLQMNSFRYETADELKGLKEARYQAALKTQDLRSAIPVEIRVILGIEPTMRLHTYV